MRDRLIELHKQAKLICTETNCKDCVGYGQGVFCFCHLVADHLLANGVIVLPCKVGDIIYALTYDRKDYMPLKVTSLESLMRWMDEDQFGHELFTTLNRH